MNLIRIHSAFEEYLDFSKKSDVPISKAAQVEFKNTLGENGEAKLQWLDEQLYTNLAALCKGPPLQMVKNVRAEYGVRGGIEWYKLTCDVAVKSEARLDDLSDGALHPKPIFRGVGVY